MEAHYEEHTPLVAVATAMSEYEATMGRLYEEYAKLFPEGKEFWEGLAKDEEQHSMWLQSFPDFALVDAAEGRTWRFPLRKIKDMAAEVEVLLTRAKNGDVSHRAALESAVELELGMIEGDYFKLLHATDDDVAEVLAEIESQTRRHHERVKEALRTAGNASSETDEK